MFDLATGVAITLLAMIGQANVHAFEVSSGSMEPTLHIGEFVMAVTRSYRAAAPARGDIIVFKAPDGSDYLKRVIGVPGDTVAMRDDRIVLNGDVLPETPDGTAPPTEWSKTPGAVSRVTLPGGGAFDVVRHEPNQYANTEPVRVPDGTVFVLGDNLDNSLDSRVETLGLVPGDCIEGRAAIVYWSWQISRIGRLIK